MHGSYSFLEHTRFEAGTADRIAFATCKMLTISGRLEGRHPSLMFRITRVPRLQMACHVSVPALCTKFTSLVEAPWLAPACSNLLSELAIFANSLRNMVLRSWACMVATTGQSSKSVTSTSAISTSVTSPFGNLWTVDLKNANAGKAPTVHGFFSALTIFAANLSMIFPYFFEAESCQRKRFPYKLALPRSSKLHAQVSTITYPVVPLGEAIVFWKTYEKSIMHIASRFDPVVIARGTGDT